jgi:hypothetical protein
MPVGLGGLIAEGLGGDLTAQLAALAGPHPDPNPQPGAGGAPSPSAAPGGPSAGPGVPQPGPPLPPAQVYAPDPANASTIQLLLKIHQQDALASDLNNRIAGIAASFGTGQQQHDKMAALQQLGGIQDDRLGALGQIQKLQAGQQQLDEHNRFMAGADVMGQQLLGLHPGQGAWLAQSGQLPEIMQSHFRAMEPTEAIKNYTQTRALLQQQGYSPAEIDRIMPPESIMLPPGASVEDRQYYQYAAAESAAGRTPLDIDAWKAQHATAAKVQTDKAMDRENANQALPDVNRQMNDVEGKVDEILNDPALPSILGKITPNTGALSLVTATPEQRALAQKIKNLSSTNYAEGFKIGGASRKTQFELGQLSNALNGSVGNTNLSEQDYRTGLVELKNKFRTTHANSYGEAGQFSNMPDSLKGYLDPEYRQGGSLTASGAPGPLRQPSDEDKKDFATIAAKYGKPAAVLHFRENGVDPSGL